MIIYFFGIHRPGRQDSLLMVRISGSWVEKSSLENHDIALEVYNYDELHFGCIMGGNELHFMNYNYEKSSLGL